MRPVNHSLVRNVGAQIIFVNMKPPDSRNEFWFKRGLRININMILLIIQTPIVCSDRVIGWDTPRLFTSKIKECLSRRFSELCFCWGS